MRPVLSSLVLSILQALCVAGAAQLPSSSPHDYPGLPSAPLGPEWQSYFEVTQPLPNITFTLNRNFAGNLPVDRAGHPNNTLFFWGIEKTQGSLTSPAGPQGDSPAPWGIWLNGGPGSSSMAGFLYENGPVRIGNDGGASENKHSWHHVADYFWIDQPVGTGYATADAGGYVADEDQIGQDFMGFLGNLVKVFPNLAGRPLYLTGESYAGTYIPYILKAYFGMPNPPVKIGKIAIGDGSMTTDTVFQLVPSIKVIETFPQLINYDVEVYKYFKEQSRLCGFDLNLTYPQNGHFPTIQLQLPTARDIVFMASQKKSAKSFKTLLAAKVAERSEELKVRRGGSRLIRREIENAKREWLQSKRDLAGRPNGTIDPWYGCVILEEYMDYAVNFTYPWNEGLFDVYDAQSALSPYAPMDPSVWLNDPQTRAAIHAPTDKDWAIGFEFPFGEKGFEDPSVEPMAFLSELATNATAKNVSVVFYSGNNDALIPHFGTEIAIQNTTFGGIQGFTKKPATPWYDDDGKFAGIVHQERGWTYALFDGASHLVPQSRPAQALTFAREFLFGSNQTGLVLPDGTVVGGEDPNLLASDILPGGPEAFTGPGVTQGTVVFPTATRDAWNSFVTSEAKLAAATNGGGGGRTQTPALFVTMVVALLLAAL
ncbi:hypothetical protein V5O48_009200 [Marasmius crinis-equi]|uniref:Carboxypeptidase n=1 Tax=Marasmius crinis-equi TaxID=585013 RepID=A0ABR3FBR5_9AGAR